ncbi:MAG: DUF3551 domain-containing protein [Rhizobiales bacterium]|nr:DUF3551 domain-containing protein [Hyphomicrobiales bacterium]
MKAALCLLGVLVTTIVIAMPARADGPWCAFYDALYATNCGFHTYEQCLATVSGAGGYCEANTMYVPPPGPSRHHPRHTHQS